MLQLLVVAKFAKKYEATNYRGYFSKRDLFGHEMINLKYLLSKLIYIIIKHSTVSYNI